MQHKHARSTQERTNTWQDERAPSLFYFSAFSCRRAHARPHLPPNTFHYLRVQLPLHSDRPSQVGQLSKRRRLEPRDGQAAIESSSYPVDRRHVSGLCRGLMFNFTEGGHRDWGGGAGNNNHSRRNKPRYTKRGTQSEREREGERYATQPFCPEAAQNNRRHITPCA